MPAAWGCPASLRGDPHAGHQQRPRTGSCRPPQPGCACVRCYTPTPSPPHLPLPHRPLGGCSQPALCSWTPLIKGSATLGCVAGTGTRDHRAGGAACTPLPATPGTGRGRPRETNIKEHLLVLAAVGAARAPSALAQMLLWGARVRGGRGTGNEKSQESEPSPPPPRIPQPPVCTGGAAGAGGRG